jgi:signal transduction histidine kinase
MNADNFLDRRWVRWGLGLGIWTVVGLFDACQMALYHAYQGYDMPWPRVLFIGLFDWYYWALLTPVIFFVARRFPVEHGRWMWHLPVHAAAAIFFATLVIALDVPPLQLVKLPYPSTQDMTAEELFKFLFARKLYFYVLVYATLVGVQHTLAYYRKFRERERQALQLQAQLAQTQLQVLKMQLHPHFLFNTLNAVSALLHQDVELADRMIARLGELLRRTLDNAGAQEVTLRQELEFIEPYLEIEKARLGARLKVGLDVDPDVLNARVPNLLLQPLVENAIRHGIAPRAGAGVIEIQAWRDGSALQLCVRDNGPGLPAARLVAKKNGLGVANTRARLEQMYGSDHFFELRNGHYGGLEVTVRIPYQEDEEAAAACGEERNGQDSHAYRG